MTDLIGKSLGPYHILRELGRGGMAIVYEAQQRSLNRRVALKVLPPQFAINRSFGERFLHEARAAAGLKHPNIVTIHDVAAESDLQYIVMERVNGEPLSAVIRRQGPLPPARVVHILSQVASALDYAHGRGIIHRDIKPANILIAPGDHVVLTDFGIARAIEGTRLTADGALLGTPEYMSPEQAQGLPVGPASDIYALGIVLYEMLTGRAPFHADSTPALLHKHVYERPHPPRTFAPGLPSAVDSVLRRALAKQPSQRFRTATEMATALKTAIVGQSPGSPTRKRFSAFTRAIGMVLGSKSLPNWLWPAAAGALAITVIIIAVAAMLLDKQAVSQLPTTAASTAGVPVAPMLARAETRPATASSAVRPRAVARQVINVYAGPDKSYPRVGQTMADQSLEVIGVAPGSAWLRVCCIGGEPVWLEAVLVEVHGALDGVALVASGTRPAPLAATRTPAPPDAGTEPPATAPSPAPTSTRTTTPTSSQPPPACRGEGSLAPVTLLSPRSDLTCNGPVSFSWQWQDRLWAGETFEIHIWPELKQNRNGVKRTSGNSVTVNLREDVLWIDWNAKPHRWEIIVVCASTGRWISRPSEARLFYYWPLEPFGNDPARNCK